jgi:hypothetical protein
MDASATSTIPRPLAIRTRLAVALLALLVHSLALTIATGLFVTRLAVRPLWCVLAWSLLLSGWAGAMALLDWGLHWYLVRSILSRTRPPPHHEISLESFGAPPRAARTPPSSTTTELHVVYTTPSQEPLHPTIRLPYRHAHDPTAPIPYYDPTALARYEWERSWAQKPTSPPAQDPSVQTCNELELGVATDVGIEPVPRSAIRV